MLPELNKDKSIHKSTLKMLLRGKQLEEQIKSYPHLTVKEFARQIVGVHPSMYFKVMKKYKENKHLLLTN